jgi:hypothetical protein
MSPALSLNAVPDLWRVRYAVAANSAPANWEGFRPAVLVRSDRFVGWRSPGAAKSPVVELARALRQILGKRIAID